MSAEKTAPTALSNVQPAYLDAARLAIYASASLRTVRYWLADPLDPLPWGSAATAPSSTFPSSRRGMLAVIGASAPRSKSGSTSDGSG